jgi:hypothetical protein
VPTNKNRNGISVARIKWAPDAWATATCCTPGAASVRIQEGRDPRADFDALVIWRRTRTSRLLA